MSPAQVLLYIKWRLGRSPDRKSILKPLPPYSNLGRLEVRYLYLLLMVLAAGFLGALVGGIIAIGSLAWAFIPATFIGILFLLAIWAMPDYEHGPDKIYYYLMLTFILIFGIWPPYISIFLPGMPWVSVTRVILFFVLFFGLISLSSSIATKTTLTKAFQGNRKLLYAILALHLIQLLSVSLAVAPIDSLKYWLRYQLFTIFVFLSLIAVVKTHRAVLLVVLFILFGAVFNSLLSPIEFTLGKNIWLDFMPPGFISNDSMLQAVLRGAHRAGVYRVTGSFVTSLEYAEYLAMASPVAVYLVLEHRNLLVKSFGVFAIGIILLGISLTGSRLGFIGFFMGLFTYVFLWAIRKRNLMKHGLLGPALVALYPAGILTFFGLVLSSRTLTRAIFGGGEHQSSNDGRIIQWADGLPLIGKSPLLGYGYGMGAGKLGYTNPNGQITIDSYFLSVALDTGLLGLVLFISILGIGICQSSKVYLANQTPAAIYGALVASSLAVFFTTKLVLSQFSNHTVPYIFLAICVLLVSWSKKTE